ncbi:MAG: twin-arginine translocase subunit TatC [Thermoflexales bacterium]|nr:twin-arginine translocase subunit TatC [Thermoflexales bacterium]MCS7324942.1 twin-arginine translocase subunit TatC [Thermoflexales bacterium]MCX7938078.1 twin-arginine translocase subunit TatC [Thermoflexales bacterium]MDW8054297.1 twin-arginine translocase subunit TatC [Anaerolineae bacterium]MDW8291541.1 twin-arginine translocase subunit TatC [Anaerolineae bacterium]
MAQDVKPASEEGMTLMEHLAELRERLIKSVIALVVGAAVGLALSEHILKILLGPYGPSKQLLVTNPLSPLTNVFVVSVTFGAILASPVVLYQILAFVFPGLLPHERRWVLIALPFGFGLFVLGAAFAFFVMLPAAVGFLTSIFPTVFTVALTPDDYIPFVAGVMFWMGVAFEMPLIVFALAKANVLNARVLARHWRWAVIIIAVIAALITPTPDPINMSLVMVPLLLLYGLSILLAALARRNASVPAMLDPEEKVGA